MLRSLWKVALGTAVLALVACDSGGYYDNGAGSGYYDYCQQFATCGACTPVLGCGWCTYGNAQGVCLSDPDFCTTQQFSWTWEPKGCSAGGDAGTTTEDSAVDAGTDGSSSGDASSGDASSDDGSSATCHWPAAADTFAASDAGAAGCLPTTGGMICASSEYALTCYGTSTPDSALGCVPSPVSGPPGVSFDCCPCAP
jgi:hypothetical protein